MGEDDKAETTDKERDAIGGFFSSARLRPESPSALGSEATDAGGQMTAAEAAGQVAYRTGDTAGSITTTGVESSSG